MTKEQEVDLAIRKEFQVFNDSIYSGEPLPKDILKKFETVIFKVAPGVHMVPMERAKSILGKNLNELTNFDVPTVLNTVCMAPLSEFYKNVDEAIKKHKEVENAKIHFNLMVKQVNEEMEAKRKRMLNLNGAKGGFITCKLK